mgnify:CR=1 FL=1
MLCKLESLYFLFELYIRRIISSASLLKNHRVVVVKLGVPSLGSRRTASLHSMICLHPKIVHEYFPCLMINFAVTIFSTRVARRAYCSFLYNFPWFINILFSWNTFIFPNGSTFPLFRLTYPLPSSLPIDFLGYVIIRFFICFRYNNLVIFFRRCFNQMESSWWTFTFWVIESLLAGT